MSINNSNFIIASKLRKLIIDSNNIVYNIPKKDYIYRNEFRSTLLNVLSNVYLANYSLDKYKYLNIIKSNLSMIDFYFEINRNK